jgi:hypothetical protein
MQNIAGVTKPSGQVEAAAERVLGLAGDLARQSERLKQEVDSFLATVRAAYPGAPLPSTSRIFCARSDFRYGLLSRATPGSRRPSCTMALSV